MRQDFPILFILFCCYTHSRSSKLSCGLLRFYEKDVALFGGRNQFCKDFYVSYESCKLLLRNSVNCTAFRYAEKICSLIDRNQADFVVNKELSLKQSINVIQVKKLSSLDNCVQNNDKLLLSKRDLYFKCLQKAHRTAFNFNHFKQLPLVHIVISITPSWYIPNKDEVDIISEHWKCYAKLHSYLFTLNFLRSHSATSFFVQRHESIKSSFLHTAQWILHIDVDSIILDMSKSFSAILPDAIIPASWNSKSAIFRSNLSVILQLRENNEITSGIYFARNDRRSICFLNYWRNQHPPWISVSPSFSESSSRPSRSSQSRKYAAENRFVAENANLSTELTDPNIVVKYVQHIVDSTNNSFQMISVPNYCNGALVSAVLHLVAGPHDEAVTCLRDLDYDTVRRPYPYPEQHCLNKYRSKVFALNLQSLEGQKALEWTGIVHACVCGRDYCTCTYAISPNI